MKNHCAYCHGKFGLVRHRRAFKSFCSRKCVDHYKAWIRAEVGKRKGWSDCLWSASLSVIPYGGRGRLPRSIASLAESPQRQRLAIGSADS